MWRAEDNGRGQLPPSITMWGLNSGLYAPSPTEPSLQPSQHELQRTGYGHTKEVAQNGCTHHGVILRRLEQRQGKLQGKYQVSVPDAPTIPWEKLPPPDKTAEATRDLTLSPPAGGNHPDLPGPFWSFLHNSCHLNHRMECGPPCLEVAP